MVTAANPTPECEDGPVTLPPPPARMPRTFWALGSIAVIILALVGATVGVVVGVTAGSVARPAGTTGVVEPLPQKADERLPPTPGSVSAIVAQTLPSVVSIAVEAGFTGGTGSGFVISTEGHIVTNNHVIDAAVDDPGAQLTVTFEDGSVREAVIVGRNVSSDIAVIQVIGDGFAVATWGDSDALLVGDAVIAIGAPLGLAGTVTSGIVSALDRPVTTGAADRTAFINAIQTDAPINPGNSGGPLINGDGQVVGVNSAIATLAQGGTAGSIGLGFSIPAASAQRIAAEIIATGSSATPVIGVTLDPFFSGPGALVASVEPTGPAARAGIQPDDVIIEIDGRGVQNAEELIIEIRANAPGDFVELVLVRGNQEFVTQVRLAGDQRDD